MNALLRASLLVDVRNRLSLPILADDNLAGHGIRDQREAPGFLRGRNHDLAGTEI